MTDDRPKTTIAEVLYISPEMAQPNKLIPPSQLPIRVIQCPSHLLQ